MRIPQWLRWLRLFLRVDPGPRRAPADFRRAGAAVAWLARFFYLFMAFRISTDLSPQALAATTQPPLWPAELMNRLLGGDWLSRAVGAPITPLACSLLGLLAVVFPGQLIWRLGIFLYIFLPVALKNSLGAISHDEHFYIIYTSFALLFLPSAVGRPAQMSRKAAMRCLMALWLAQLMPLLSYSLSGLLKIAHSGSELLSAGGFVGILFLCLIYIQVSAIFALFRPHLHRPLGIALILFHLGATWLLNVDRYQFMVVLGLLFVFSPFAPPFSARGLLQSLPLLGIPVRLIAAQPARRAAKAWLIYDGECPVCRRYALHLDLKRFLGELVLVNAREGGPIVDEVRALPHDLNEGMVLKIDGRFHRGDAALHALALLSDGRKIFGAFNRLMFHSRASARLIYPLLKLGRRALLKIKGVPMIDQGNSRR